MMIFNCRVMLPLTYHISSRYDAEKFERWVGSRVPGYTRLSRRLAAHGVTKIKMYASRTRGESTSGEVEACPINHPPLKISSSARLQPPREADHAAVATRATRSITGVSRKSARHRQHRNQLGGKLLSPNLRRGKTSFEIPLAFARMCNFLN